MIMICVSFMKFAASRLGSEIGELAMYTDFLPSTLFECCSVDSVFYLFNPIV
ncbi:hypothetical protein AGMMS49573_10590 [Endomicrobiia bacterium]|nr:hypothetical protein AGMMS49573_10590 [Endomicrobiia bacterium]